MVGTWAPGRSGGGDYPDWPAEVSALLSRLFSSDPPSSYSAAASELHRRLDFQINRASVRRWALQQGLAPDTHNPDAFTQWGAALHFYGVALRYAPTPQAKGKIERRHDYWQKRLPPLLATDQILELGGANTLLQQLLAHANPHEIHRELGTTRQSARCQALAQNRSALRPAPACPWWPYLWSLQTHIRVGDDGKAPVGPHRLPIAAPPRSTVLRCQRYDGDVFSLRPAPDPQLKPTLLLHCPVF